MVLRPDGSCLRSLVVWRLVNGSFEDSSQRHHEFGRNLNLSTYENAKGRDQIDGLALLIYWVAYLPAYSLANSRLSSLPVGPLGISSTIRIDLGHLKSARRCRQKAISSSASHFVPSFSTTKAATSSP